MCTDDDPDYGLDAFFAETPLPLNLPLCNDKDGRLLVDRILRYEDLNAALGRRFGALGVPWAGSLSVRAKPGFRDADRLPAHDRLPESYKVRIRNVFARKFTLNSYPTR